MRIYEEYIKRYNLSLPIVKHINFGCIFLRNSSTVSNGIEWLLYTISFKPPSNHPGEYIIRTLRPIHDGCKSSYNFQTIDEDIVEWDKYESHVMGWIRKKNKNHVIHGTKEVVLTAWEIFIHTHDSFFAKNYSPNIIFNTIDDSASIKDRYNSYQECINILQNEYTEVYNYWKFEMVEYIRNYSHWLSQLVIDYGETPNPIKNC